MSRDIMRRTQRQGAALAIGLVALVAWPSASWAVVKETQAEKTERLKQQINPDLFKVWGFDHDQPGHGPSGLVLMKSDDAADAAWTVEAHPTAPSAPHALVGRSHCAACTTLLVAEGFQYEYPELAIRIHQGEAGADGQVGVLFALKDARNFYATLVDVSRKTLEVVRVIDGRESVLGRAPLKTKPLEWHTLRMQRNTIISKEFVEIFFDGVLTLSVQDQSLGSGQVGMVLKGETTARVDNFKASPQYSSRPLSPPAAY